MTDLRSWLCFRWHQLLVIKLSSPFSLLGLKPHTRECLRSLAS